MVNFLSEPDFPSSLITAAIANSPALDLNLGFKNLGESLHGFYNLIMTNSAKEFVVQSNSSDPMRELYE